MRIASYNIRKAVGLDWKRKPSRILDVLTEIDADVVLLQEADRRFGTRGGVLSAEELQHSLSYKLANVSIRPQSHGWHGNVILYRDTIPLVSTNRISLPRTEPRGAVSASFDVGTSEPLLVIGTHLALIKRVRRKQYHTLCSLLAGRTASSPIVIGGDFNERSPDLEVAHCFGGRYQVLSPGPSFHASRPIWSLDRFVCSDTINVINSDVHLSQVARRASDHLPIYLDFEMSMLKSRSGDKN